MNILESKNINLLIDFDSTFIKDESLELFSSISLKEISNKDVIIKKIAQLTTDAMEGNIKFSDALNKRIKLLQAHKDHIKIIINKIQENITDSFLSNKQFFNDNYKNCYIISGGFIEIIYPIVKPFKIEKTNIFANQFLFNENNDIISLDKANPLSKDEGKVKIAKRIKGTNIIIGDGFTDYEVKKYGAAEKFIQFSGNINRKKLNPLADYIANDFNEIINCININFFNQPNE